MKTVNYESILPKLNCDPSDMLEALTEKLPRYMKKGLFKVNDFVVKFSARITRIVRSLPEDIESRKLAEVELAHIMHTLYTQEDLVMSSDAHLAKIRTIELLLEREGVFDDYIRFSQGKDITIDTSNPGLCIEFLDYLCFYIQRGLKDVTIYFQTCVWISQLDGGSDILLEHLAERFAKIPRENIQIMMDENNEYLGEQFADPREAEDFIDDTILLMMQEERIGFNEARKQFQNRQEDCAALHFFLAEIYNEYILPKIDTLPQNQQFRLKALLNDFRDIVDPGQYVPLFFHDGNVVAHFEREKIVAVGRDIH